MGKKEATYVQVQTPSNESYHDMYLKHTNKVKSKQSYGKKQGGRLCRDMKEMEKGWRREEDGNRRSKNDTDIICMHQRSRMNIIT